MATPTTPRRPASGLAGKTFRMDIQGLRALAVGLVLVFHVWPSALPGGYVGVDVFFVISGYLITGILLRQATGGKIDFLAFYARRARRLLPAATATMLAVAVASFLWMPAIHWHDTAQDVIASAFYVMNWWLAGTAGDYFASDAAASPLQHFWSLAIEEQFYLIWPAMIAGLVAMARHFGWDLVRTLVAGIAVVVAASLAHSIIATVDDRAWAYFATTTRAWELAIGALLAIAAPAQRSWWNAVLGVVGLAMIVTAAAFFDATSPFPGWIAALPVLGTAAVIHSGGAGGTHSFVHRALGSAVPRYLGGTSYSLYLWHWPLIIFAGFWTGSQPGLYSGLLLIVGAIVLADLSKRFLEDPIYKAHQPGASSRSGIYLGVGCLGAAAAAGFALLVLPGAGGPAVNADTAARYPGAAILARGYNHDHTPGLASIRQDIPADYRKCHGSTRAVEITPCPPLGPSDATVDVAVVGDSHAGQWIPALAELANKAGLRIHIHTKSSCPFTLAEVMSRGEVYEECSRWNRNLMEVLRATRPAIVVSSASSVYRGRDDEGRTGAEAIAAGQQALWRELESLGAQVVVIRDTPRPARVGVDPAECLAQRDSRPADCSLVRAEIVVPESEDPNVLGARALPSVHLVDLTDYICSAAACDPIVGNVVVWRDNNHLTASYAMTLAPALYANLGPLFSRPVRPASADPIASKSNSPQSSISGVLRCGPSGDHPPFERRMDITVSEDNLHARRGDWRQREGGFEVWHGKIASNGQVSVTGQYREGPPDIKAVELNGSLRNGTVALSGRRGPRECRFTTAADLAETG